MNSSPHKTQLIMCWLALVMVCGEFGIALFDLCRDGKLLALYMAINALLRETKGGQHYHDLVVRAVLRTRSGLEHCLPKADTPSAPATSPTPEAQ